MYDAENVEFKFSRLRRHTLGQSSTANIGHAEARAENTRVLWQNGSYLHQYVW